MTGHGAGKGDRPRPVDRKKWDENWARIKWTKDKGKKRCSPKRRRGG
jgi:hypothetical protein